MGFRGPLTINGLSLAQRHAIRQTRVAPLVASLEQWMRAERGKLSRHADVAKAMDYMLKRWVAFTRFLDDGRIWLTNNAAERALRSAALGRKAWLFAGSDRGGERTAAMYSLIITAKLNDIDPHAWLADVLARIADHPASRLHGLLPWNWVPTPRSRRLTMAAPSYVLTIRRVARMLNELEDRLHEIALGMEPEHSCLTILDVDDGVAVIAFTAQGIENLIRAS